MGGALGAANTGMLSTAVYFLASSVDLFHRRTAGPWGKKLEALFQNALTHGVSFIIPLQLGLTPHSLPAHFKSTNDFCCCLGELTDDHRLTGIPEPLLDRGFPFPTFMWRKKKKTKKPESWWGGEGWSRPAVAAFQDFMKLAFKL